MKKSLSLFFILAALLTLCGCDHGGTIYSNHRKIDELQIVRALGIDLNEQSEVKVSVSTTLGEKDEKAPTILRAVGPNITRTLEFIQEYSSREDLFIAPMTCAVIGEDLAKSGLESFLDHVERSTQIRLETDLFIVRGDTASSLFSGVSDFNYEVSEILSAVKHEVKHLGISHVGSIREVSKNLAEGGVSLVCAVEPVPLADVAISEDPEVIIARQAGFAVIKDGRLAGYLPNRAARGACFLLGIAADGTALIEDESGLVSLSFSGSDVKMNPVWQGDLLKKLIISISIDSAVLEQSGRLNIEEPAVQERLGRELGDYIKGLVNEALDVSRNMGADFIGIGGKLNSRYPIKFATIKDDWENVWNNLDIELNIDATVKRRYDIGNPQSFDGSQTTGISAR